jgi:hypothetical protein
LACGLIVGLIVGLAFGLIVGLVSGLVIGLIVGLTLRLRRRDLWNDPYRDLQRQLERGGLVPQDYVRFLDFAAEHVLLQRIGGGYRFVHALLLDYFAEQWAESGGRTAPEIRSPHASKQVSL